MSHSIGKLIEMLLLGQIYPHSRRIGYSRCIPVVARGGSGDGKSYIVKAEAKAEKPHRSRD
jgi:hypothetical protein